MPARLADWQVHLLKVAFDTTPWSNTAIGKRYKVGRNTVWRIRLSYELFGTPYPPSLVKKGAPRALNPAQEQLVLEYLKDRPTAYLDEVAWFIYDETDIIVHERTIWNILFRAKWSRKTARRIAHEKNSVVRLDWVGKSARWRHWQLIFIDESASCERTGWRKFGWSPVGMPCDSKQSIRRSQRWSILPALSVNGYLEGTLVQQGSITADIFVDWLANKILPQTVPGQILVMDNCRIHHDQRIIPLVAAYGCTVEYLPPYSPDFNPIELSFHALKAWVKRHILDAGMFPDFGHFMVHAISEFGGQSARGYFEESGYRNP